MRTLPLIPFLLILLLLVPYAASAGTVTRTITYSDAYFNSSSNGLVLAYKVANITLTPAPLSDFNMPGYFVIEYLPSGISLISANADQYKLVNNSLSMLKFNPNQTSPELKYSIKLPREPGRYVIYGTFKDENKKIGEIQAQTITIEKNESSDTFTATDSSDSSDSNTGSLPQNRDNAIEKAEIVRAASVSPITGNEVAQTGDTGNPYVRYAFGAVIVFSIIGLLIMKKIKTMPVTYEFTDKTLVMTAPDTPDTAASPAESPATSPETKNNKK